MRGTRPFVFSNLRGGQGVDEIVERVRLPRLSVDHPRPRLGVSASSFGRQKKAAR